MSKYFIKLKILVVIALLVEVLPSRSPAKQYGYSTYTINMEHPFGTFTNKSTLQGAQSLQMSKRDFQDDLVGMQGVKVYTPNVEGNLKSHLKTSIREEMSTNLSPSIRSLQSIGIRNNLAKLSENISATLESFLEDYDKKVRPGLKEGRRATIRMNIFVRSMGPITEKERHYSLDCYLRQEWYDERLKFKGPLQELTLNIQMLDRLWKPDTYFHNGLDSYVHTITRPNKLFRIKQNGHILYSMRLTIKAKCPMSLRNFPMDKQSCPLLISSFAYTEKDVLYQWDDKLVKFEPGMTLSQYDLLNTECRNYSARWRKGGVYSVLQVNFNFQRHTGYFLIQVYIPCILIVVLSWVSFWINREATSDRIALGITAVLTLSTISLDTRTDLPKVHYATALDWFILMSFGYCIATLLQFALVHNFTKVGTGEGFLDDDVWDDIEVIESFDEGEDLPLPPPPTMPSLNDYEKCSGRSIDSFMDSRDIQLSIDIAVRSRSLEAVTEDFMEWQIPESCEIHEEERTFRAVYPTVSTPLQSPVTRRTTETQTVLHDSCWSQFAHCVVGDDKYRRERRRQAIREGSSNSVSIIDSVSRVVFPLSYGLLNLWYWYSYYHTEIEYIWSEPGFDYEDDSISLSIKS